MTVAERTYAAIALEDPDVQWELHKGFLREKPGVSAEHSRLYGELTYLVRRQIDPTEHIVKPNGPRVRSPDGDIYIPDLVVIPTPLERSKRHRKGELETYDDPLPLVVEVWSPSTGRRDLIDKIPAFQARGDSEIWRLHPFEQTLTRWIRQPEGSYVEEERSSGVVELAFLPGVRIDLDELFAMLTD